MSAHSTGSSTSRGAALKYRPPFNASQMKLLRNAPEMWCPHCKEKVDCYISWTETNFALRFYRCNGQTVRGQQCNFLEWIDKKQHEGYVRQLLLAFRDASAESKKECHDLEQQLDEKTRLLKYAREELRSWRSNNLEQQLENKTRRIQELEEQLENKARRMQQLEKARGSWFSVFLWLISVFFAMFVGAALEYGKSN